MEIKQSIISSLKQHSHSLNNFGEGQDNENTGNKWVLIGRSGLLNQSVRPHFLITHLTFQCIFGKWIILETAKQMDEW